MHFSEPDCGIGSEWCVCTLMRVLPASKQAVAEALQFASKPRATTDRQ